MSLHYLISCLLLCFLVCSVSAQQHVKTHLELCVAIEDEHDDLIEEEFDFGIPFWQNFTLSINLHTVLPPFNGIYEYKFNFCNSVDMISTQSGLGWNFGVLRKFVQLDIIIPFPPDNFTYVKEFVQVYEDGDVGPPCAGPRSAVVNIYCGMDKANCTGIPGNNGPACIAGNSTNPGFCLCGIVFNSSICTGLDINILSNNCTKGYGNLVHPPVSLLIVPATIAGEVIGTIIGILLFAFCAGYVYNRSVLNKKGLRAVPLYDSCTTQKQEQRNYTLPTSTYGTIDEH